QYSDRIGQRLGPERIAADQFGKTAGPVGRRHFAGTHLDEPDRHAAPGDLPCRFAAGQTRTDHRYRLSHHGTSSGFCFLITAFRAADHGLLLFLLFHHQLAALGTWTGDGFVPGDEVAFRIPAAAVKGAALFALPLHYLPFAALGTGHPRRFEDRFGVAALRKGGAGQKPPVPAHFVHHRASALFADLIGNLV